MNQNWRFYLDAAEYNFMIKVSNQQKVPEL